MNNTNNNTNINYNNINSKLSYSQKLQTKINQYIDTYIQLVHDREQQHQQRSVIHNNNTATYTITKLIRQIITSSDIQDWLIINSLIQSPMVQQNPKLLGQLLLIIQSLLYEQQQSYVMHVYLYGVLGKLRQRVKGNTNNGYSNYSNSSNMRYRQQNDRSRSITTQRLLKVFAMQGKLSMFNSWLIELVKQSQMNKNKNKNDTNNKNTNSNNSNLHSQIQQTLQMLLQYYPLILDNQRLIIQLPQLQFILHILTHVEIIQQSSQQQQQSITTTSIQQQFDSIHKLLKYTKTYRINISNNNNSQQNNNSNGIIDNEEHQIIAIVMDILAQNNYSSRNINKSSSINNNTSKYNCSLLIFFPQSKVLRQSDVRSYVALHSDEILSKYSQTQLVNIFTKLFTHGIEQNTLALLRQLSLSLKQAQRFYQLKTLYKHVILPYVVSRGKATHKLQSKVLQIASFYIIGFYQHTDIGINGLKCVLMNINKINHTYQQLKHKWIELALLLAQKNLQQYQQLVYQTLIEQQHYYQKDIMITKQLIKKIDQNKGFDHFLDFQIWQITIRNSKKYKVYYKNITKLYKGIENNNLQCYIITVMQALFTTHELPRVLKQFHAAKWNTLSHHMQQLFKNLKSNDMSNKSRVTVDYVKKYSPQQFALQDKQEDAQQYLSKVLERVEEQLIAGKQNILLEQFYKSFRFNITRKLQCQHCSYVIGKSQELFIHTVPNRTSLRENHVEQIQGYKCEKCKQTKFLGKTTFQPTSKILIIHINRFSFTNGKSCKQLATQPIQRNFLNYRLKGIIFHIGKIVECGHYVYYFNLGGKKWIEMNDHQVNQFQLENQDQQFQREMKSQMTPYILFYVRK